MTGQLSRAAHTDPVLELQEHRDVLDSALRELDSGWDSWPALLGDSRLAPNARLSGVLVLLAADAGDQLESSDTGMAMSLEDFDDPELDWMGRATTPWRQLARAKLPWSAGTATLAVRIVTEQPNYDDRRIAIALRGARQVCAAGQADPALLDALTACRSRLDNEEGFRLELEPLQRFVRRILASATHPELLDLSLIAAGDSWGPKARAAAAERPAEQITPLVRLLGDLGPGKPPGRWLDAVAGALEQPGARELLHSWLRSAADAHVVAEWPGAVVGDCAGTLFIGTNADIVRAAVWATVRIPHEIWPADLLGVLARRGAAHNGVARYPEALALKVATAAVAALDLRGGPEDREVLVQLQSQLQRRDLLKRVAAALARPQ